MKSSTVRRSGLSKESMDIIENLANETPTEYAPKAEADSYNAPSEYYRETDKNGADNKSKEIDLLWQSFKSAQFSTNSTFMHVLGGFILGVITTAVAISLFGMFVANSDNAALKNKFAPDSQVETSKIETNIDDTVNMESDQKIPADEIDSPILLSEEVTETVKPEKFTKKEKAKNSKKETTDEAKAPFKAKKYIIKDGDTVEAIIIRNYGSYTPERAEAIMKANNLKNLDHISIDQELLLPIEK